MNPAEEHPSLAKPIWIAIACVWVLSSFLILPDGVAEPDYRNQVASAVADFRNDSPPFRVAFNRYSVFQAGIHSLLIAGIPYGSVTLALNIIGSIAALLNLWLFYLIFRRYFDANICALACLLSCFTPAIWYSFISVLPIQLSLTILLICLLLIRRYFQSPQLRLIPLAIIMALLGVALKIDAALFLLPAIAGIAAYERAFRKKDLLIGASLTVALILAFVVVESAQNFSFTLYIITTWINKWAWNKPLWQLPFNIIFPYSTGFALCLAWLAGTFSAFWFANDRKVILPLLLFLIPQPLFWGLLAGNSARHTLPAIMPMMIMAALLLVRLSRSKTKVLIPLVVAVLVVNCLWVNPPQTTPHRRSTSYLLNVKGIESENMILQHMAERIVAERNSPVYWSNPTFGLIQHPLRTGVNFYLATSTRPWEEVKKFTAHRCGPPKEVTCTPASELTMFKEEIAALKKLRRGAYDWEILADFKTKFGQ